MNIFITNPWCRMGVFKIQGERIMMISPVVLGNYTNVVQTSISLCNRNSPAILIAPLVPFQCGKWCSKFQTVALDSFPLSDDCSNWWQCPPQKVSFQLACFGWPHPKNCFGMINWQPSHFLRHNWGPGPLSLEASWEAFAALLGVYTEICSFVDGFPVMGFRGIFHWILCIQEHLRSLLFVFEGGSRTPAAWRQLQVQWNKYSGWPANLLGWGQPRLTNPWTLFFAGYHFDRHSSLFGLIYRNLPKSEGDIIPQ